MRERGDRAGFAGSGVASATTAESVAACICRGVRRQYAIAIAAFQAAGEPARSLLLIYPSVRLRKAEYDLILLKISSFRASASAFSRSSAPDANNTLNFCHKCESPDL